MIRQLLSRHWAVNRHNGHKAAFVPQRSFSKAHHKLFLVGALLIGCTSPAGAVEYLAATGNIQVSDSADYTDDLPGEGVDFSELGDSLDQLSGVQRVLGSTWGAALKEDSTEIIIPTNGSRYECFKRGDGSSCSPFTTEPPETPDWPIEPIPQHANDNLLIIDFGSAFGFGIAGVVPDVDDEVDEDFIPSGSVSVLFDLTQTVIGFDLIGIDRRTDKDNPSSTLWVDSLLCSPQPPGADCEQELVDSVAVDLDRPELSDPVRRSFVFSPSPDRPDPNVDVAFNAITIASSDNLGLAYGVFRFTTPDSAPPATYLLVAGMIVAGAFNLSRRRMSAGKQF